MCLLVNNIYLLSSSFSAKLWSMYSHSIDLRAAVKTAWYANFAEKFFWILCHCDIFQPFAKHHSLWWNWRGHKIRDRLVLKLPRYPKIRRGLFLPRRSSWCCSTSFWTVLSVLQECWPQIFHQKCDSLSGYRRLHYSRQRNGRCRPLFKNLP